jgi:hypothetical protein
MHPLCKIIQFFKVVSSAKMSTAPSEYLRLQYVGVSFSRVNCLKVLLLSLSGFRVICQVSGKWFILLSLYFLRSVHLQLQHLCWSRLECYEVEEKYFLLSNGTRLYGFTALALYLVHGNRQDWFREWILRTIVRYIQRQRCKILQRNKYIA